MLIVYNDVVEIHQHVGYISFSISRKADVVQRIDFLNDDQCI